MQLPLLISDLTNIRYLTGVKMTFGIMILDGRKRMLFVDSRYSEKAEKEAAHGITVLPIDELEQRMKQHKRIRFEAEDVSVARLARWKKKYHGTTFVPSAGVIEDMRRVKSADEIAAIRKACKITDQVLINVPKFLHKQSITERALAWEIEKLSRMLGAESMAFETIVGFGDHTARPHHSPTNRILKKRDVVQIDMGVMVEGYCSDCSRVFFVGKPSEDERKVFELLVNTVIECTKKIKAGVTNHALDHYARKMLGEYEQLFTHGLGHGVGLHIHEGASLSKRSPKQSIKHHEVITIEPGIYIAGKFGMRIEDTVLVEKNGAKILTKCRKFVTGV